MARSKATCIHTHCSSQCVGLCREREGGQQGAADLRGDSKGAHEITANHVAHGTCIHEQSKNHISLKNRPTCYVKYTRLILANGRASSAVMFMCTCTSKDNYNVQCKDKYDNNNCLYV